MTSHPSTESSIKRSEAIKRAHKEGKYSAASSKSIETKKKNGTNIHSASSKEKIRIGALASKHQRVCKSTHDFTDKKGRVFRFDSTWEDALARRLDELDVEWDRPGPVAYVQDGKTKNYFPDFYLPKHQLYLDPKNAYCLRQQKPKLDLVKHLIKLAILPSLADCQSFDPMDCEAHLLR